MWSSVLVLALVTAADPLRLFATFLVVSRPRPVPNLLAYLVGCLMINVFILRLIPLIVLHFTPMFRSFLEDLAGPTTAGESTVQPVPIGIDGLALLIAAVMTVRLRVSQRANSPTQGGDTSTMVLESNTPTKARGQSIAQTVRRRRDLRSAGCSAASTTHESTERCGSRG